MSEQTDVVLLVGGITAVLRRKNEVLWEDLIGGHSTLPEVVFGGASSSQEACGVKYPQPEFLIRVCGAWSTCV